MTSSVHGVNRALDDAVSSFVATVGDELAALTGRPSASFTTEKWVVRGTGQIRG